MNRSINLRPYLEQKSINSYSEDLIKNIKMVSFFPDGMATPFGSFIYKMQKYPGDVDLLEEFTECCNIDQVVDKFIFRLKNMVNEIVNSPNHYFSEFKAGIDHIYDIDVGELINGVYHIPPLLRDLSIGLYDGHFLTKDEITIILNILDTPINNGDGYDEIFNLFRNKRILRWSVKEILAGKKILGNRVKTLHESLKDHTHVKIDVILLYNNRFIEMTNFVGLVADDGYGPQYININLAENHNIPIQLPIEIEKLYFSNYYYSPFKMAKRIYSLSRNKHDDETLRKIIPLVTGDISLLYQIKSEIEVLLRIYEINKTPPIKTIFKELDQMKGRISTVLDLDEKQQIEIFKIIDNINKTKINSKKVLLLENLNDNLLKPVINSHTIEYLESIGFNPPPSYLLPPQMSYAKIIRKY